jgi:hypothetical protein
VIGSDEEDPTVRWSPRRRTRQTAVKKFLIILVFELTRRISGGFVSRAFRI